MTTTKQVFVTTGPLAGKTLPINGHEFVDGKMTYVGGSAQIETLARILADYGVVKEGEELRQGQQADMSDDERADPARSVPDYTDGRKFGNAEAGSAGGAIDDLQTDRQDRLVEGGEVVKADPDAKPSGEAQDVVRSDDEKRLVLTEPTTGTQQPQDAPATPAEQASGEQPKADKQPKADEQPKQPSIKDESEKPTLGEAVAELDPDADADWTSNNLPSIERLSAITGIKVTRAQVDEVAEGYTRARARQAKQQ